MMNKDESEVKCLNSIIAFDAREADHEAMVTAMEAIDTPVVVSGYS
jgi:hypothetical protein